MCLSYILRPLIYYVSLIGHLFIRLELLCQNSKCINWIAFIYDAAFTTKDTLWACCRIVTNAICRTSSIIRCKCKATANCGGSVGWGARLMRSSCHCSCHALPACDTHVWCFSGSVIGSFRPIQALLRPEHQNCRGFFLWHGVKRQDFAKPCTYRIPVGRK